MTRTQLVTGRRDGQWIGSTDSDGLAAHPQARLRMIIAATCNQQVQFLPDPLSTIHYPL